MIESDKWVWMLLMIALLVIAVQEVSYRSSIERVSKNYVENCAPILLRERSITNSFFVVQQNRSEE